MSKISIIQLTEDDVPGATLKGDIENYTNVQLKRWLQCRGLKLSGRRADLIQRCKDAMRVNTPIDVAVDSGKWYEKKVHDSKKANPDSFDEPKVLPITGWKEFSPDKLPVLFNYGHVYHWLVESLPALTKGDDGDDDASASITEKQLLRGRQYVYSGFVNSVRMKVLSNIIHFKAQVDASMKQETYTVTVSLSCVSGAVRDASCHCKASALSRCSHVAALLLTLNDSTNSKTPASTDLPCLWKKGKKKQPSSINSAIYKEASDKKTKIINFDPRPLANRTISDETINNFVSDLYLANYVPQKIGMWQTVFPYKYEHSDLDNEKEERLVQWTKYLEQKLKPVGTLQSIGAVMIPGTEDQSATAVWESHRYLRMTASTAKESMKLWDIVLATQDNSALVKCQRFLRKNVWGLDSVTTFYMRKGLVLEESARAAYAQINNEYIVEKSGLWVSRDFPQLSCSPDGLVFDPSTDSHGLIEIKALKLLQNYSVSDLISAYNNQVKSVRKDIQSSCFKVENNSLLLKITHAYYYQIQFQLGVTGFQWCDFILYSSKGPPSIERIRPDSEFISKIMDANLKLWKYVVAPEIKEQRTPRDLMPYILKNQ